MDSYNVLSAVIEGTPDAVFVKDLEGRYLLVNSACARFIGKPFGEIIGRLDTELYTPDTAQRFIESDRLVIETGETQVFEGVASGAIGTQSYRVTKGVIRDEEGEVIGLFGISHDITDRLRAEEERVERVREQAAREAAEAAGRAKDELLKALRESEERYRSLLENANDIIYSHDLEGKYLAINRAGERITGYTREEILGGLNIAQVVAPEHLERAKKMTERKLRDPSPTVYEIDIITIDGRRLTLEVSTRVAYREGEPVAIEGIARDVTERKRAQEALARSEERLALAQEAGNVGTFDWDIRTNELLWTPNLEVIFGILPGRFGGKFENWRERMHPEDLERCEAEISQALESKAESWQTEYRMYRADTGEMRWIDARSHIFYDDEREPLRMVGINLDFTERKRIEQELERLLASEQSARGQAEEASRIKDEFLATVSHELRTPLTAIVGWTHMLRGNQLDGQAIERALEIIERNARSQTKLIDDLLDISRVITGKLLLDVRTVEPASLVEAAIESVLPAAEAKGVRIQKVTDTGMGLVSGDPARLQQVVWNLLSNAIKFTPKGGRVQVRLERVDSQMELTVSDTGIGIKPEFMPYVFDRFRQADMTSTREHGGLGLGLAIVRHLVELHGGTVRVESAGSGQGATFIVTLPLTAVRADSRPERRASSTAAGLSGLTEELELHGVRVLVVEDEKDAAELISTVLRQRGAEVMTSGAVPDALAAFGKMRPDVVISDIGLPGEDGYDLIRKVRALPAEEGGRTPAVALTAYARAEDRVRSLLAGFQVHVPKPVDPGELIAVIASLTGRTHAD